MKWAIFDIDGTLLPASSMEKMFFRRLLLSGNIPVTNIIRTIMRGITSSIRDGRSVGFAHNKAYITNLDTVKIESLANKWFEESIFTAFSNKGLQEIEKRRGEGYKILIMSGSPQFIVGHLRTKVEIDHIISSPLERKNGKFTGRINGLHPYGVKKRELLKNVMTELEIDFKESVVYANHHTDIHHMEMFGEAVAVNPSKGLKIAAKAYDWQIINWK